MNMFRCEQPASVVMETNSVLKFNHLWRLNFRTFLLGMNALPSVFARFLASFKPAAIARFCKVLQYTAQLSEKHYTCMMITIHVRDWYCNAAWLNGASIPPMPSESTWSMDDISMLTQHTVVQICIAVSTAQPTPCSFLLRLIPSRNQSLIVACATELQLSVCCE